MDGKSIIDFAELSEHHVPGNTQEADFRPAGEASWLDSAGSTDPGVTADGAGMPVEVPCKPGRTERLWRPIAIDVAARLGSFLCIYTIAVAERVPVMRLLRMWDGRWFLLAARTGYPSVIPSGHGFHAQSALGFFPGFPLVIRGVVAVTGFGYEFSALIAVWMLGLVASVLVWQLLCDYYGPLAADGGTAFVLISPAAFVLGMVYSEALLVAAVAGCLLALRRHHWLIAGLCGAIASSTDPLGVAVAVPCVLAAIAAIRHGRRWRALIAPLLAPAGVSAYFGYLWVHTGTPFAYYIAQRRGWQGGTLGMGLISPFAYLYQNGFRDVNDVVKAMSTIGVALLLVFFLVKRRPDWPVAGYVIGVLGMAAISPIVSWTPRVALRAFPVLGFTLSRLRMTWMVVLIGLSSVLMAALAILTVAGHALFTP
ncbi:MAG: ArnT family glycosyltransferase [Acidimicrobiales bacterium]